MGDERCKLSSNMRLGSFRPLVTNQDSASEILYQDLDIDRLQTLPFEGARQ